ncbi:MAG: bifunctional diaminohydroxyphosphoribosylaminopyrimidine deaminase/5-amino-6-(5-phosphoribosylamino)uracil reductase RibD, partial [Verrucomicrobiota bacterium]|nr:bifunctional diaminohydroxyphosphoribosylaminopyrimidine deaminase/5-amino-6-(5-phosphoribosylamino)uracil reductase RibD [Verrucomicrobiota bacterium]
MSRDRDERFMHQALMLARKGYGRTSPNPMVGALLVKSGRVIGEGWHKRAGAPHAEIEAIRAAANPKGATLYVTLEPCSTVGRTPPCVEAVKAAGIRRVVVAASDPNPVHIG